MGIIDWDVVCAGRPTWDLAFFAWHWVPLHSPSPELAWRTMSDWQRRLRLITDSYGLMERTGFLNEIVSRIEASRAGIIDRADAGDEAFTRLHLDGHPAEMQRAIDFICMNEQHLQSALDA